VLALCGQWLQSSSADDLLEVLERQGAALVRDRARGALLVRAEQPGAARAEPVSSGARTAARESDDAAVPSERRQDSLAEVALQHLARLQRVTSVLSEAVSLSDVFHVLCTELAGAVAARRAWLALASEDEGVLESIANASPESIPRDASEGLLSDVRELLTPDEEPSAGAVRALLEQAYHERRPLWPSWPLRVVALPLSLGPRILGAVALELSQPGERERALLEDLVRPLALALDRARLYELARLERDRAAEANQAKDEFLAVLGHELRNPLAPISTALELMRARAGEVALKERGVIERQLNHMVRLVDDLLDVARITRGSLRLSRSRVELAEVVDRAVEMASPMLDARSHRLSVAVPRRGLAVDIDFHRVAQALGNLLMNAAKYTSHGGTIELSAHLDGQRVVLEVRDDGIGIEPELLRRIFEPFVQRKQALDRSHGGLGLGLTIARRLVELHGGTMKAASAGPGQGSTFTIELNLAMPTEALLTTDAPPTIPPVIASSDDAIRVLVVDDNVDAAEMLAEALRIQGHQVGVAHDGPAALALVEEFQPDLALLDIGLPVMDGFDLAQRLKRRLSAHPPKFIAVTGYGQPSDRVRSQQAGFDEHLVKPIDLARLNAIVSGVDRQRTAPPPAS
jgi:signal transduction histidine kinase/ActR/RegA family two-component response regulator